LGAPLGSEAVGDLSEDDAGSQGLLGAVVGGRNVTVGNEDEQVLPEALDDPLEFVSGLGVRHDLEQFIELGLEPGVVGDQGGIGQGRTAAGDARRALEQGFMPGAKASSPAYWMSRSKWARQT
jgi:hypothetical protein